MGMHRGSEPGHMQILMGLGSYWGSGKVTLTLGLLSMLQMAAWDGCGAARGIVRGAGQWRG
jgi:hypothetical protein